MRRQPIWYRAVCTDYPWQDNPHQHRNESLALRACYDRTDMTKQLCETVRHERNDRTVPTDKQPCQVRTAMTWQPRQNSPVKTGYSIPRQDYRTAKTEEQSRQDIYARAGQPGQEAMKVIRAYFKMWTLYTSKLFFFFSDHCECFWMLKR